MKNLRLSLHLILPLHLLLFFFLFTFYFLLFSSTAFGQWWVKGGNLIWPYGNVSITNGQLSLSQGDLRLNNFKVTSDSLNFEDTHGSYFRFNTDGIENSVFELRAYSYGEATDAVIKADAANGIDITSPWINFNGDAQFSNYVSAHEFVSDIVQANDELTIGGTASFADTINSTSDIITNATISAHNVIETSSLEFVVSFQIDEPFTAYSGTVHLNETGSAVDTVIYDNSTSKLIICFKPNANFDITNYDVACLPVPVTFDDDTTALNLGYLTAFTTELYAPTSLNSITGTLYNSSYTGLVTDFASGFFYLYLKLIPQNDANASGYQTLSAP